ncbi:branched-chain amino acid ABC transporter permease [Coralliovum pocilloporae]|uniref:branched-chain amino acid ABC transporter permease n=1 Tax=Coralliovum pocilloporae TaxID=3066369 RepID=UPI003306D940
MDQLYGYMLYLIALLTMGGIYAVLTLGLNVQWGFGGLFNAGIAGFFGIGAYTSALLTTAPSVRHLGGFEMPYVVGFGAAMLLSGIIAYGIGKVCLKLRSDYLAIATIGIAEIFRLILKNETWATNGPRGVTQIPKPFEGLPEPWNHFAFLGLVLAIVAVLYLMLEVVRKSPWGRVMTAIRENETAVKAAGKNVETFRMEGFVIGCMIMALAGALMAHYLKFVDPNATEPLLATFLVWVMLIIGGSANNKGAIVGAFLIWGVWSATEILTGQLPTELAVRTAYVRIFLIGLALQIFLQKFPQGFFPEVRPKIKNSQSL